MSPCSRDNHASWRVSHLSGWKILSSSCGEETWEEIGRLSERLKYDIKRLIWS